MVNYKIIYVLTDDCKLKFYNEMMKSILSLRYYMKDVCIEILSDNITYDYLKEKREKIFSLAYVHRIEIPNSYSIKEKSRYLKVRMRELIEGDFLFIDCDTVICCPFPECISKASIGMVYDFNVGRSEAKSDYNEWLLKKTRININDWEHYYNSGVIWCKDVEESHILFKNWKTKWEETRLTGVFQDQPALNWVIYKNADRIHVETLLTIWNVQIAGAGFTPVQYLADAIIIHYFQNTKSPFLLCHSTYRDMWYDDERILEVIHNPRAAFSRCKLFRVTKNNVVEVLDDTTSNNITASMQYKLLRLLSERFTYLFKMNEWILSKFVKMGRIIFIFNSDWKNQNISKNKQRSYEKMNH